MSSLLVPVEDEADPSDSIGTGSINSVNNDTMELPSSESNINTIITPTPPSSNEHDYTTALATDPEVVGALKTLDGMWTTTDYSGQTALATDPEVVGALKTLDDMWKKNNGASVGTAPPQHGGTAPYSDEPNIDKEGKDCEPVPLRESIWTKSTSAVGDAESSSSSSSDEDEGEEDLALVDGKQKKKANKEKEIKTIGMTGGGTLINLALADAGIDLDSGISNHSNNDDNGNLSGPAKLQQQQQQPPRNPLSLFGIGARSRSNLTDEGNELLCDNGINNDTSDLGHVGRYSDAVNEQGSSESGAGSSNRQNRAGLFGFGKAGSDGGKRRQSNIDDEGASAPPSRRKSPPSNANGSGGSTNSDGEDKRSSNTKSQQSNGNSNRKMEGIGGGGDESTKRQRAVRNFFRKIEDKERSADSYKLDRMDIARNGEEEPNQNNFWNSKVGKITKGILVPELYGDEALEEIEGDTSNFQKGKYGHLSMSGDESDGDADGNSNNDSRGRRKGRKGHKAARNPRDREIVKADEDEKALEDTLRDQIRMLGGRVMELESELAEKDEEVNTLSDRVEELEAKLAKLESADKANATNLIKLW